MKAKPKGARYRNLTARGSTIYYERVEDGRRVRHTLETDDWTVAAERRDAWEALHGTARAPFIRREVPTFADLATRYLEEDTSHLAATTKRDRESALRENGPLLAFFGPRRMDEITPPLLRDFWSAEVVAKERATQTGRHLVNTLAAVLGFGVDLGLLASSPVATFRESLRRRL